MPARLWVFGSFTVAALVWSIAAGQVSALPLALPAGLVLWTVIEYLMHRYAFHGFAPHWEHHQSPKDAKYILAPFPLSLGVSAGLWIVFALALRSAVLPGLVLSGVWIGYLAYEAVHLRIHGSEAGGRLLRALRRYHYRHHFADDTVCYGVTSPLWDVVFRTR
ncbi:MAG TPA: sterol desaturase family protein [Candidatus Sulfopaludibacter sp.]|nr:sterol desaturase family protein [Candidatus Sulfopaludibacter sp.]